MKKSFTALALGTLGLGISEYVMMGILPDIASDINITIPMAGQFISAYALGVCVGAPLMVMIARKKPLKSILIGLFLIYLIGNIFTAAAPSYPVLLAARFIAGLPHGAYFGVGSIAASKLAERGKETSAIAAMVSGMTIANLIGVPLGTWVSHEFSWRFTYLIVVVWGLVTLFFLHKWVPEIKPLPDNGFRGQFRFLKTLPPWILFSAILLGNGGIFCWYSYVSPFMTNTSGFDTSSMTGIMVLAGLGMVIGNYISGKLSDKYSPAKIAYSTQGIVGIILLLIFAFSSYPWISLLLMCICTAGLFALSAPQQILLNENSHGGQMLGATLAQVAFNLGNALGAYTGGFVVNQGYSYEFTALPGVFFAFTGYLLLLWFYKVYNKAIYCKVS